MFPCPSYLSDISLVRSELLLERFSLHNEQIRSHFDKGVNSCSVELSDLAIAEIDASLVSLGYVAALEGNEEGVESHTHVEAVEGSDLRVDSPAKDPERAET